MEGGSACHGVASLLCHVSACYLLVALLVILTYYYHLRRLYAHKTAKAPTAAKHTSGVTGIIKCITL
jgi:hypothetical protein